MTVNGDRVTPSFTIQNGDVIGNRLHRHEPPVTDDALAVLHNDGPLLVVNKPSSIPVRRGPTGPHWIGPSTPC